MASLIMRNCRDIFLVLALRMTLRSPELMVDRGSKFTYSMRIFCGPGFCKRTTIFTKRAGRSFKMVRGLIEMNIIIL